MFFFLFGWIIHIKLNSGDDKRNPFHFFILKRKTKQKITEQILLLLKIIKKGMEKFFSYFILDNGSDKDKDNSFSSSFHFIFYKLQL